MSKSVLFSYETSTMNFAGTEFVPCLVSSMHSSLWSFQCHSFGHTVQIGAWCGNGEALDLFIVRTLSYLDLFSVEPIGCQVITVFLVGLVQCTEMEMGLLPAYCMHSLLLSFKSYNVCLTTKKKKKLVPNVALVGVWAVKYTLFLHQLVGGLFLCLSFWSDQTN